MSVRTTPTKSEIISEGLGQGGESSPESGLTTRAESYWFWEILKFIANKKDWNILEETKVLVLDIHEQRIALPSDYEKMLEVTFYKGNVGTLTSASSSTVTFTSGEDAYTEDNRGKLLFITDGSAKGQMVRITTVPSSGQVSIAPNFGTTPSTDSYMIPIFSRDLEVEPYENINPLSSNGLVERIAQYNNEFYLDSIPDESTYAIVMKFIMNISKIDDSSDRYSNILSAWEIPLIKGIKWKCLDYNDDDRRHEASNSFKKNVSDLAIKDGRRTRQRRKSQLQSIGGIVRA